MKLLIDTKAKRVLCAEVGKDVVDFLFSLLALPVATAAKLVGTESVAGSVGNLYASVEKLDDTYVLPGEAKDALLRPSVVSAAATTSSSLLRLTEASYSSSVQPKTFYRCPSGGSSCSHCSLYVTDERGIRCPFCSQQMTTVVHYTAGQKAHGTTMGGAKGFVQGIVTYTVTDNLAVTPMSTISSITLLNTFGVRDIGDLQEKTVQLGYSEGLEIFKASLHSQTVLTDVFLGKKASGDACGADTKQGKTN